MFQGKGMCLAINKGAPLFPFPRVLMGVAATSGRLLPAAPSPLLLSTKPLPLVLYCPSCNHYCIPLWSITNVDCSGLADPSTAPLALRRSAHLGAKFCDSVSGQPRRLSQGRPPPGASAPLESRPRSANGEWPPRTSRSTPMDLFGAGLLAAVLGVVCKARRLWGVGPAHWLRTPDPFVMAMAAGAEARRSPGQERCALSDNT
jgi:hypothetical protein